MRKVLKRVVFIGLSVLFLALTGFCLFFPLERKETVTADAAIVDNRYNNLFDMSNRFLVNSALNVTLYDFGFDISAVTSTSIWSTYFCVKINLPVGSYTLAFNQTAKANVYIFAGGQLYGDGQGVTLTKCANFTISAQRDVEFRFYPYNTSGVSNTVSNIQLLKGTYTNATLPEFQYDYDYIYNKGYTSGNADGLTTAQYGIFANATLSGTITYLDENTMAESEVTFAGALPNYTYSSIYFDHFLSSYGYPSEDVILERVNLNIDLHIPFVYSPESPLLLVGDSLVTDITLIDVDGVRWTGSFDHTAESRSVMDYELSDNNISPAPISTITLYIGRASDILDAITLFHCDGNFTAGYDQGYYEGKIDGASEGNSIGYNRGYSNGYDEGYEIGNSDGYNTGYLDGYASSPGTSDLSGAVTSFVFSLFDAPIAAISPILDFEVAGIDFGAIIGFILTVTIVVSVVKLL